MVERESMKSINKSNPTEEVKNTNYRMHKGKKGWLVSYSLLSFVLGGVYMNSVATTPVKAAEVEAQSSAKTADKEVQNEVDEQSLSAAQQNAATVLDNKANSVKADINNDQKLSADDKAAQIATVDTIVNDAKAKVDEATDLVSVKDIQDTAITNISACYQAGSAKYESVTEPIRKTTEKIPLIDKSQKPISKKVTVSTYKGLSSFFKTVTNSEESNQAKVAAATKDSKKEATSTNAEENTSLVATNSTTSKTESAKLAGVATREDEPATDTSEASVAGDKDESRPAFNDLLGQASGKTETSVDVAVPKQVTDPDKSMPADVATLAQLAAAWNNPAITYVNITADLAADPNAIFKARTAGASIVINGNGHTVDMGSQKFEYASTARSSDTYLTLTNTNYKQGFGGSLQSQASALVYVGGPTGGNHLGVNIDNIRLTKDDRPNYYAIRGIMATGSKVTFSGKNVFVIANEIVRGAGSIFVANDSSIIMERTEGAVPDDGSDDPDNPNGSGTASGGKDAQSAEFAFSRLAATGTIGEGNQFVMGDRSSNTAVTLNGIASKLPALSQLLKSVRVGDDVSWTQKGFPAFIQAPTTVAYKDASFVFGQNFKLDSPETTGAGAIKLSRNQSMVFNAGTVMDINQVSAKDGGVIVLDGTSSLTFISPKQLHLSVGTDTSATATKKGIITGKGGTFKINNSSIRTWDGLNSSTSTPAGQYTGKFKNMTVINGKTTVAASPGSVIDPNIITATTRELQTDAITPGKVKIQYIDQSGKQVGQDYELPFGTKGTPYEDTYIGEQIPLVSQDIVNHIPAGYMWALDKQIYAGAKTDKQSGGAGLGDKGDADGQANLAYVPMDDGSYTYKVYVYGAKQNVTYKYVDVNHPDKALVPKNIEGIEADNGLVTANYGNTIDWTNKYYTETNVPAGYHYKTDGVNQPATTLVSETNPTVVLYVEGDEQEIVPTYLDGTGNALAPTDPIVIKGRTGDIITIPEGPQVPGLIATGAILNGTPVAIGTTFEMPSQKDLSAEQKYTLVYKYGNAEDQKQPARDTVKSAAEIAKTTIDLDKTLTTVEKNKQKDQVDTILVDALTQINAATTQKGINDARDTGCDQIRKVHLSGDSLEKQRAAAIEAIKQHASSVKDAIDQDTTLAADEKAEQKQNVDQVTTDIITDINNEDKSSNADNINQLVTDGKAKLDAEHKSHKSGLEGLKDAGKKEINDHAAIVKDAIDKDTSLSADEKSQQKQNVDRVAAEINAEIDKAGDADSINKLVTEGKPKLDAEHKPNKSGLDGLKDAGKKEINDHATIVKDAIDKDVTLTADEKTQQKQNVDRVAAEINAEIDKAGDADSINKLVTEGKPKLDAEHKPHTNGLDGVKADGKKEINDHAAVVKDAIDKDASLSDAEKTQQKQNVDRVAAEINAEIDKAIDADSINKLVTEGKPKLDAEHKPNKTSLNDLKEDGKKEINDHATIVKDAIDKDVTLTADEKTQQKQNVDRVAAEINAEIDKATDNDSINKLVTEGKPKLDAEHKPGKALNDQKDNAKQNIDQIAATIKDKIDADKNLTPDEKNKQKQDANKAASDAKDAIDKAKDADEVNKATEDGKNKIEAAYKPGTDLSGQRADAKNRIDDEAELVKGQIAHDVSLDNKAKAEQTAAVDAAATTAKNRIDSVSSAESIQKAIDSGIKIIDSKYVTNSMSLAEQKKYAQQLINDEAAIVKELINNDSTLNDTVKAQQARAVDTQAQKAINKIAAAADAQGVKDEYEAGINAIHAQHVAGTILEEQKAAAKADLDQEANTVKKAIANDLYLTEEEKANQTAAVEHETEKAQNAIDRAETVQEVKSLRDTAIHVIDTQYVPGVKGNGSGSNGSGSNGSDSNGSGSNGSESNGSGSNGSDANGSDSNGSDSNGSGSNGSESNGSDSNGSGSNGSDANGSGSNGSGSNGSGSNSSDSNGSNNSGSGNNSSSSNGTGTGNGGSSNTGSGSNNTGNTSIGSGSNGSGSNGSSSNGSGSNGSDTASGTAAETAGVDTTKAADRKLTHNAYFYNKDGKRANLLVAKKGSTITTYGTQTIGNREFYETKNGLFVAVNNFRAQKRTLKKNAFVYKKDGTRVGGKVLKKNSKVATYGDPIVIRGKSYFIIDNNRYVKAANFGAVTLEANNVPADGVTSNAVLGHDAYVYNSEGQQVNNVVLSADSEITTGETKTINGRQFIQIGKDEYVDSDNVTGTARTLTAKAYVYSQYGNRIGKTAMNAGETVQTYGDVVVIKGKTYYSIGNKQFVKQTAFE